MKRTYRIGEVARRLHLSVEKVRDLAGEGALKAERTDGGHRLFRESDVAAYERKLDARPRRKGPPPRRPKSHRPQPVPAPPMEDEDEIPELEDDEDEIPDLDDDEDEIPDLPDEDWEGFNVGVPTSLSRPSAAHRAHAERDAQAEPKRLQDLKNDAMKAIPYDVPPAWRAKVIGDLETQVTTDRLPPWVPAAEQTKIARGRVEAIVKAYRDECTANATKERERRDAEAARARAERDRQQAQADAERRVRALIDHGKRYLEGEIDDFDWLEEDDIRAEVERLLRTEVKADWSERDVEDLVDEELEKWESD